MDMDFGDIPSVGPGAGPSASSFADTFGIGETPTSQPTPQVTSNNFFDIYGPQLKNIMNQINGPKEQAPTWMRFVFPKIAKVYDYLGTVKISNAKDQLTKLLDMYTKLSGAGTGG